MLRERGAGIATRALCSKDGVPDVIFDKIKAICDGAKRSEARQLRALKDENAQLMRVRALSLWPAKSRGVVAAPI